MPLAKLDNFQKMIRPLHQAVEIVAPIHNTLRERQNNWLHLPLEIHPFGLSSGKYPGGGSLDIHFKEGVLFYHRPTGATVPFPLKLHTQGSLLNSVLEAMQADELATYLADVTGTTLVEGFIRKRSQGDADVAARLRATYTHQENLSFDTQVSGAYADALYTVFTGVARFRSRLNGHLTPIVVWPEHFDLSTLWFRDGDMDENKAHLNFGFAPYTSDMYERPYLYAYAYPYPDPFVAPELPAPAFWNPTGWRGVVVHYDEIAAQPDPALFVENLCLSIFNILKPLVA